MSVNYFPNTAVQTKLMQLISAACYFMLSTFKRVQNTGVVMAKTEAFWNGQKIAASDDCIEVEGNPYFPPDAIDAKFLSDSAHTSHCGWKGTCNYMNVVVEGATNTNAAWVYKAPLQAAALIAGYVAFWKGVEVKGKEHAKPMGTPEGAAC
jgi:uncharacterized protein (DUF427 family)